MSENSSVLATPVATLNGFAHPNGGSEFRGIRFAQAERFGSPQDFVLQGNVDAQTYGSICPQLPGALETMVGVAEEMNEDCHFLNVYVPHGVTPQSKLPVLVWIHGGAYTNGSGSLSWYNGSSLAQRNCVVVTVNYRLGIFGFLGESNLGTQDMMSALRWVNKYIAHFGGDSDNVTIFGESAGGSAVISLMACTEARELFHKAWAMSPSIGQLRDRQSATYWLEKNIETAQVSKVEELATMSTEQLLDIQKVILTLPSKNFDMYSPTGGGSFIDENILVSAANDRRPLVIGTNRDENRLWSAFDTTLDNADISHWHSFTDTTFGVLGHDARSAYEKLRPDDSVKNLCSAVQTDLSFRSRAIALAESRARVSTPTWMYWFTWQSPAFGGILGCCHALDIPFAFDNLHQDGAELFTGDGAERSDVAQFFADSIAEFSLTSECKWPSYDLVDRSTMEIDAVNAVLPDPEREIRILFTS